MRVQSAVARDRGPLVSLIMPFFRTRPDWFRTAVASALDQRDCRIELIVVDDGSPEPAEQVLVGLADSRLRIIRIPHLGPGAARNAGLASAQGDCVRFVDSDDVLVEDSTRHLLSLLNGDDVIAYGATLVCDENLQPYRIIASDLQGHVSAECLLGQFDVRLPALLFPRRVVQAAGSWDPSFAVSGDWEFVLRTLDHASVAGDRRVALHYRRHGGSISRTARIAAGEAVWHQLIGRYLERHPELRRTSLPRRARAAAYLDRGFAYWNAREYEAGLRRLALALLLDPDAAGRRLGRTTASLARRLARSIKGRKLTESTRPIEPRAESGASPDRS